MSACTSICGTKSLRALSPLLFTQQLSVAPGTAAREAVTRVLSCGPHMVPDTTQNARYSGSQSLAKQAIIFPKVICHLSIRAAGPVQVPLNAVKSMWNISCKNLKQTSNGHLFFVFMTILSQEYRISIKIVCMTERRRDYTHSKYPWVKILFR